jgi:hypothetical protein
LTGSRIRCASALFLVLTAIASVTASAQVKQEGHAVSARGSMFLRDGQPFIPVVGAAVGCPDATENGDSASVADNLASIRVNVIFGHTGWCGDSTDTQVQRLDAALGDRMLWYDPSVQALPNLPSWVDWQAPFRVADQ